MEWNGVSVNIERNDLGSTVWITLYAVRWKVLRTIRSWRIPPGSIGAWNWILSSPPRFLSTVSLDGKSWTRASFYELGHV